MLTTAQVINDGKKKGVPIAFLDKPPYYESLSVAIDKASAPNSAFIAALSKAVEDMHADGTLSNLSKKYFDGLDLSRSKAEAGRHRAITLDREVRLPGESDLQRSHANHGRSAYPAARILQRA